MRRIFVETSGFREIVKRLKDNELFLEKIQSEILTNPEAGDLIQGSGGVRKLRISDTHSGKGKSGGYRVIYLDLPDRKKVFLITAYRKGTKDDLSHEDLKIIKALVTRLKKE